MNKKIKVFLTFIFYSLCARLYCVEQKLPFLIAGVAGEEPVTLSVLWDEKWFGKNTSFVYDHNIARIACMFSDVAYADVLANPEDNVLKKDYALLGVKNHDMEFYYNIDYNHPLWGNDQCAFSIASKEIDSAQGKRTLIFVVIRGTPQNANEWISNLNLNDDGKTEKELHEGFARAAQQIHTALLSYFIRHKITPQESYMLITGHSRGAAVSNMLAANLSYDDFIDTKKVYAYTFAAPNVTTLSDAVDEKYNYIWNIVNAEDIVPTVPLNRGKWSYKKYGTTLTLVNYWNIDQNLYEENYLPRMNKIHNIIARRDYFPFRLGPFIPVQITSILSGVNKDVDKYYSKDGGIHKTGKNLLKKLFSGEGDSILSKIISMANNDMSLPENVENKKNEDTPLYERIISWLNIKTDGFVNNEVLAFNDMHACESYFSWMLALEKDEAFSTLGYSQIVLKGQEEGVVVNSQNQVLARIVEGRVVFSSLKQPIIARPSLPDKVIVGFPGNMDFNFIVSNESIFPTKTTITVEHYDCKGMFIESYEKEIIYPRRQIAYTFDVGKYTLQNEKVVPQKISGKEGRAIRKEMSLEPEYKFSLSFEHGLDTDLNYELGLRLGSRAFYGTILTNIPFMRLGKRFDLIQGFGTQITLTGPVVLDLTLLGKYSWVYTHIEDGDSVFNFVPQFRVGLRVSPITYISIHLTGLFDLRVDNFNNAAFYESARQKTFGELQIGDKCGVATSLQASIKIRFN